MCLFRISNYLYVSGIFTFIAFDNFILNTLISPYFLEAFHLNLFKVKEYILLACALLCNKTKSFFDVKEFNSTDSHMITSFKVKEKTGLSNMELRNKIMQLF